MKSRFSLTPALAGMTSAIALLATHAPAMAQADDTADPSADQGGVSDIIVTAQRRQESVQDVPIAITAFGQEELEQRGIVSALDVAQFVPNLVGLNNTGLGTANSYYLRGIGNTESIATFDPPIGTYVDDIYLSRQNANNLSLFDVNRIEVLRGPQGTLFGRNTTGGAINVYMNEPGDDFAGYAEIGYGSYDQKLARASLDVPLADSFAIKVSGYWQDDDGYTINTTTGERDNQSDGWGVRLGLRGELSDSARWTGSYIKTSSSAGNTLNFDCDPANPANCNGRFATTGLTRGGNFVSPTLGALLTGRKANFGLGNEATMDFIASNFEFELGDDWAVNIITGFVDLNQDFAVDFGDGRGLPALATPVPAVRGFPFGGFTIVNEGEHTQFTQEIKFTGSLGDGLIDVVGGVFYFHEDNRTDFGDIFTLGNAFPLVLADRVINNKAEAWAGYVQADLNLTDQLTVTAGIRYTDEEKTFAIRDNRPRLASGLCQAAAQFGPSTCIDTANLTAPNGLAIPTRQSVDLFTPRFAVNYQASDDVLLFASATRGFKSGGWNARGTNPGELLPFGPETAWSYEAGAKTDLFNRLVRLNVTAFWLDVSDLQTPSAFVRGDGSLAFLVRNFADYRNKGLEVEFTTVPVEGLNLFASLGYQDDEYRIDANAPALDEYGVQSVAAQRAACLTQLAAGRLPNASGTSNAPACGVGIVAPDGSIAEPVRTPEFTIALGGSYDIALGDVTLTPSVNANWRSSSEVGTSNVTFYDQDVTGPTGTVFPSNTLGLGNLIDPITGSFSQDRWILNASLTLSHVGGWALVAECRNCLDEEAVESSLANFSYLNPPRTWVLRAKYDF
ncbi:TonB-dependent receptor [Erythrobacter sp. BLCC-B19]|uniref:TonB-dependent receptor n=1 Tax=Erythrobacter sp. BLCC-B19 TaxID=3025315 RepID=UPI00235E7B01|nr:TonB-dependent receptor [Erythrobacter sp. BLCC-B19]WDA41356.1 TonB-dependent receptor [Erythrobacter sp. BLCC-B19]